MDEFGNPDSSDASDFCIKYYDTQYDLYQSAKQMGKGQPVIMVLKYTSSIGKKKDKKNKLLLLEEVVCS